MRSELVLWTWNVQRKYAQVFDAVAENIDANGVWAVVCLQEVITPPEQGGGVWLTTRRGHRVAVGHHMKGVYSTAIMVNNKLSDYIDYEETRQDIRESSIVFRARLGHKRNLLWVQLLSVHMQSAIGHDMCELDHTTAAVHDMMKGKRFMNIVGADGELIRTRSADTGIGTALRDKEKPPKDGEHSDMLKMAVSEWEMQVLNTFEEC